MGRARDWCKHYNGTVNETCRAGVKYADVELGRGTPKRSLPCLKDQPNELGANCDKCEFRTPEEVAAMEAEQKKRIEGIGTARAAIVESCGGKWKKGMPGVSRTINCPVCGKCGTLDFSRSSYNGHIHARCRTPGCVSWME